MSHWWGHTLIEEAQKAVEKVIETVTEAVEDTVEDAVDYASDLTNRGLRGGLLGTMAEGAGDAANLIGQGARAAVSTVQRALDEVGSTVQKGPDMDWFKEDFIMHSGNKPPDRFAGTTNPHEKDDSDDEYVDADERGVNSSGGSFYPKNVHGRSTNDMMRDVRNKAVDKLIMAGRWPSDENLQLSTIDHMIVAACAAAQQKVWDEWQEMTEDVVYSDSYLEYLDNKE